MGFSTKFFGLVNARAVPISFLGANLVRLGKVATVLKYCNSFPHFTEDSAFLKIYLQRFVLLILSDVV